METDEDAQPNATLVSSPYHVPGIFPDSPELPRLPSTERPTLESQASDALDTSWSIYEWWTSEVATSMKSGWGNCTGYLRGCSLRLWAVYRTKEGWLTMICFWEELLERVLGEIEVSQGSFQEKLALQASLSESRSKAEKAHWRSGQIYSNCYLFQVSSIPHLPPRRRIRV